MLQSNNYGNILLHLCSNGVRSGGEKLGDTCCVEASLREAKRCSKSRTASSYHHGVELVIHNWVLSRDLQTETKKSYFKHSNREAGIAWELTIKR